MVKILITFLLAPRFEIRQASIRLLPDYDHLRWAKRLLVFPSTLTPDPLQPKPLPINPKRLNP